MKVISLHPSGMGRQPSQEVRVGNSSSMIANTNQDKFDHLKNLYSKGVPEFQDEDETTYIGTPRRSFGYGAVCTSHAEYVASHENGLVCGFLCKDNPSQMDNLAEGHDFAFVDGRFIVDTWLFNWECQIDSPVLDTQHPADREVIRRWYGDPEKWVRRSPTIPS